MKVHAVVGSPNCRKVLAVIDHLGEGVDVEHHDLFTGDLRSAEFLALNPNAMVPVLTDGTFKLWESNAIMQYLADKFGSDELFPRDPRQRADVVRWQCWELCHFNKALGTLAWETQAKPAFNLGATDEALVRASQESLERFAPVLDSHLEYRQYMVGDSITIADYAMIHLEGFKETVPFDWSPYLHLNGYFDRMREVDHWARTAPPSRRAIGRKPKAA